jgi:hypothetical protein
MEETKLNDAGFIAFTEMVVSTVGTASIEVLYAWYYNTFTFNQKSNKKSNNEAESK